MLSQQKRFLTWTLWAIDQYSELYVSTRSVADPGRPAPPPLFFEQNEGHRAKKFFLRDQALPPFSQGLYSCRLESYLLYDIVPSLWQIFCLFPVTILVFLITTRYKVRKTFLSVFLHNRKLFPLNFASIKFREISWAIHGEYWISRLLVIFREF